MTTVAFINNLMGMDGLVLFFILLLLFGAKKLPELARGMGQAVNEFNKAKDEFQREITKTEVQTQPAPGQQPHTPAAPAVTGQLPPAAPVPPAVAAAAAPAPAPAPTQEPSHTA